MGEERRQWEPPQPQIVRFTKKGLPVVVEVGHLPTVLLVIVVVRVCRVVGRRDALGVRSRCSVVKVDLGETAKLSRMEYFGTFDPSHLFIYRVTRQVEAYIWLT